MGLFVNIVRGMPRRLYGWFCYMKKGIKKWERETSLYSQIVPILNTLCPGYVGRNMRKEKCLGIVIKWRRQGRKRYRAQAEVRLQPFQSLNSSKHELVCVLNVISPQTASERKGHGGAWGTKWSRFAPFIGHQLAPKEFSSPQNEAMEKIGTEN